MAHSCPRLYELNTVAYWIVAKEAHTPKLRARINQIAQVAIELSIKRGTTFLNILKADRRGTDNLHKRSSTGRENRASLSRTRTELRVN